MNQPQFTVTIEKLVQGGRGLARLDSEVVFVRGAIPSETVTVIGAAQHKGYQEATVRTVLAASPDRVVAPCPVYDTCGGCQLQHLRYEAQLTEKREILRDTLARVGKMAIDLSPVIASPHPYGYRHTIRFAVFRRGAGCGLGFYESGSRRPVLAADCLLVPEATRAVIHMIEERLVTQRRLPFKVDELEIRGSAAFGSTLLVFRSGRASRDQASELFTLFRDVPDIVGQVVTAGQAAQRQRWVDGRDWIADRLDDLIVRVSDRSFMQANWLLNETLVRTVAEWVAPAPGLRVLELYAGIGLLGLSLARRGALVTQVESNPYASADARHAAKTNHIGRCRFRAMRAETMLQTVQNGDYDVVVADPPRAGLSLECLQALVRLQAPRLLYLSCEASTLARDLGRLCESGYRISRCQPFDMFPQTAHLETLVELIR